MAGQKKWFVIVNPTSGNGICKKKWPEIEAHLRLQQFQFEYVFTAYSKHSAVLIQEAILSGFRHIICVGGDGTLHNIINGIMSQAGVASTEIKVGVIPIGTGNDWVKTHRIPRTFHKAIAVIKKGSLYQQDLGKIQLLNADQAPVYFNNLAGIGFDGYVVSKVHKYKHWGALAYLLGALRGLFAFKNFKSKITLEKRVLTSKTLMILVGLCKFSGGGMQLTKQADPFDGLFDISIVKNIGKLDIIKNLFNLFNGKITNHKKVETLKSNDILIEIEGQQFPFIQADGELIGNGGMRITLIPKAFSFYCQIKKQ